MSFSCHCARGHPGAAACAHREVFQPAAVTLPLKHQRSCCLVDEVAFQT